MPDFRVFVPPYVDTLKLKTEKSANDYRKILNDVLNFMEQNNFDFPNDEFFEALSRYLSGKYEESTYKPRISLTRKFFKWVNDQMKGDTQMTIPEMNQPPAPLATVDTPDVPLEQANFENTEPPAPSISTGGNEGLDKSKTGRPKKYNEPRKKFTVYLTQEYINAVKALAFLDGLDTPSFTFKLFEREIEARRKDLDNLRSIRKSNLS